MVENAKGMKPGLVRSRVAIALVGFALIALASWAQSARAATHSAPPPAPVVRGTQYLALGDSVTFGYEEPGVVPAPNYKDAASFHAYPEQLGGELHVSVANAACPGETSSSLINPNAKSNGCENTLGNKSVSYRAQFPLHVHYTGSQLAFALSYLHTHHKVRLVSLMIGANDLFVCVETTKDACSSHAEQAAVLKKIGANVHKILSAIRTKAGYTGQIAIVNYYSTNYASPTGNAESLELDNTLDTSAKPFHVEIANGFGVWRTAASHSGGNDCLAGLLTQLGSTGKCGIHPSYAGQALLAEALERAIRL